MALTSFAVTSKLICVFVLAYANCLFSNDAAQIHCYVFVEEMREPFAMHKILTFFQHYNLYVLNFKEMLTRDVGYFEQLAPVVTN